MPTIDQLINDYPALAQELRELLHLDDEVRVYRDHGGEWRWRRRDPGNHERLAVGGESFDSRDNALRAAARANPGCAIVLVDDTTEGL